ncbi:hypothetical protein [Micromonospora sp. NPDC048898]|uniref:hypothetical protein n=1 Tax=Micromonospora sp. NPDC048898 TaxID=3364260 RepID=UPI003723B8D9
MSDFRGDTSGVSTLRAALTVVLVGILATGIGVPFIWDDRGSPREVTTTGTLTGSHPSARHEKRKGTWYEVQLWVTRGGLEFLPAAGGLALTLGALRVVIRELLKRRRRRQALART